MGVDEAKVTFYPQGQGDDPLDQQWHLEVRVQVPGYHEQSFSVGGEDYVLPVDPAMLGAFDRLIGMVAGHMFAAGYHKRDAE